MPKLFEQVIDLMRRRHYSHRTELTYIIHWMRRFILFHRKRHPSEMGAQEITEFLNHQAGKCKVAASTQNQAQTSAYLARYASQRAAETARQSRREAFRET
jgi:hypothetical protein